MKDADARRFAEAAVHFWAGFIPVKVNVITTFWGEWQRKHGPYTAMYQTAEEKAARCAKSYRRPTGPTPIGTACHKCRGIIIAINERQRSRREIWNTAAHEVVHIAHPSWDEKRVEAVADLVCKLWTWQMMLPAWRPAAMLARVKV